MKSNLLPYYIYERLNSIKQHLKAYAKDADPKRLHQLRLDIKKINALYTFLDHTHEEKFHAPDLKKLFKFAGNIREHNIHIETMQTMIGFPEKFIVHLKKETIKLENQFVKQIPVHVHVIDRLTKVLLLPVELPSKKAIKRHFEKEQKKIEKNCRKNNRKIVHLCRINIKQLLYVYSALPEKIQKSINIDKRELLAQEIKIGHWHNTLVTVHFLSKYELSDDLKSYLSKLKKREKSEFKQLLNR